AEAGQKHSQPKTEQSQNPSNAALDTKDINNHNHTSQHKTSNCPIESHTTPTTKNHFNRR
ncbi:hypothetical protein V2A89_33785, partial [Pseudomonas aeruginosa]